MKFNLEYNVRQDVEALTFTRIIQILLMPCESKKQWKSLKNCKESNGLSPTIIPWLPA